MAFRRLVRILHDECITPGGSRKKRRRAMPRSRTTQRQVSDPAVNSLAEVLHAEGPEPERQAQLALYSWLIGRWTFDITTFAEDGATHQGRGEIHAGWVLQG